MLRIRDSLKKLGKRIASKSSLEGDLSAHHCSSCCRNMFVCNWTGGRGLGTKRTTAPRKGGDPGIGPLYAAVANCLVTVVAAQP